MTLLSQILYWTLFTIGRGGVLSAFIFDLIDCFRG